jgi:hypothetical protein
MKHNRIIERETERDYHPDDYRHISAGQDYAFVVLDYSLRDFNNNTMSLWDYVNVPKYFKDWEGGSGEAWDRSRCGDPAETPNMDEYGLVLETVPCVTPYLSVGAAGHGLVFHSHGSAFSAMVRGEKTWVVAASNVSSSAQKRLIASASNGGGKSDDALGSYRKAQYYSSPASKLAYEESVEQRAVHADGSGDGDGGEEMSKVTRMDCVQRAGDVVYVPPRWLHNTWNVVPSVSISFVRLDESSP